MSRKLRSVLILSVSCVLVGFAFLPTPIIHSLKTTAAYGRYINSPSEETRRDYKEAFDRANRPFHALQYVSALAGIALLVALPWVRRERKRSACGNEG